MPWYTIKMLIVLWYKGGSVHPKLAAKFGYIVPKLLVLEKGGGGLSSQRILPPSFQRATEAKQCVEGWSSCVRIQRCH